MASEGKIIRAIRRVLPTVVSIATPEVAGDSGRGAHAEFYPSKSGERRRTRPPIPKEAKEPREAIPQGGGSGFFVHPSGLVMTNKHVTSDASLRYTVVHNDEEYSARVVSIDPINDVAILTLDVPKKTFPTLALGNSSELELGQSVIAIGNALGMFSNTVSLGIISGLSRTIAAGGNEGTPLHEMRGLIQTDAAINPGNSGGPLIDLSGRAIGINTAVIFNAQSIGFAIPINSAKRDLEDVQRYGHIKRPFLGIRYLIIDEALKRTFKLPVDYGAYVTRETARDHGVVPGSPAEKAGVKEGDIILECNGARIDSRNTIQDAIQDLDVGESIILRVLREGKTDTVSLTLTERG